jgi:hypothetical protein
MAAGGPRYCGKAGAVKRRLAAILVVVAATVVATLSSTATTTRPAQAATGPGTRWPVVGYAPNEQTDNAILQWDEELLEYIRLHPGITGPTITARAVGVLHTATYDAWAPYDAKAVDTRQRLRPFDATTNPDPVTRQPESERTPDNKKEAISYAAYTTLVDLFPSAQADFAARLGALGYPTSSTSTPATIGIEAANAVLAYRHEDGSYQQNNYVDPTNTYAPVNDWKTPAQYPTKWQPLCVPLPPPDATTCSGNIQKPLSPHWGNVATFGPLDPNTGYPPQFALPGPPSDPSSDTDLELRDASNLSETQKAKADYWADGPHSEFPPGHMAVFAQALSRMRKNTLDQDVKLFFVLGSAVMDASISAWKAKYQYDSARPITAIRARYYGKKVNSWLGVGKGYGTVLGQNWIPYQEPTVVTPPFPEYVSGHSTFSAAGRTVILQFYNNNDAFNASVVIEKGSSKIEKNIAPSKNITITWKTLSDAADDAGWSRRWGGIHFYSGDQQGRALGRLIGYNDWNKALTYFSGDATAQT